MKLKVSENKEQLIQLIFNDMLASAMLLFPHKLSVTGIDPVPIQILKDIYPIARTYEQLKK